MKVNPIQIRCSYCNDLLTDGEIRANSFKARGLPQACYQCSQSIIARKKKEFEERWPLEPNDEREAKI